MNIDDSLSIKYKFKIQNVWYKKGIKIIKYPQKCIDFNSDNGPGPNYDEYEYEIYKDISGEEWTLGPGIRKHLKQNRLC